MKKILFSVLLLSTFVTTAFAYDQEFLDAHKRMYVNEMTRYITPTDYQPDARVTREQAAKFFVVFDRVVMQREAETLMYCVYTDEATFDPTLTNAIQSACNRGLMRGADGIFGAREYLTKAQALTILLRSLEGTQDEQVAPRWKNYFTLAQQHKLTKETNVYAVDKPLTRYELALLLWRVENPLPEQQDEMSEIGELLLQLGLQAN